MILFKDDWKKYPNAVPHYETKNKTWIDIVETLDSMGVENCLFPLALHNPALKHVDPHADDLDHATRRAIYVECTMNPWYIFREVARVPAKASANPLPFRANRGNIALFWCFFNSIDFCLIQPRQTGKSISVFTLIDSLMKFYMRNSTIPMITKSSDLRIKAIEDLKELRDALPGYLVPRSKDDPDNAVEFSYRHPKLNNSFKGYIAKKDRMGANNLGRGMTVPNVYIDEVPFCTKIEITMPAALASAGAAKDEARAHGQPYGNLFTTTAGPLDTTEGKYFYDILQEGTHFDESFYDSKDEAELRKRITVNAKAKNVCLINGTFSHRQLGYTDQWLYGKMQDAKSKGQDAEKDYLNRWSSGTLSSPLEPHQIDAINASVRDMSFSESTKSMILIRWFIPKGEFEALMSSEEAVILGLDTSDAIGRDSIAGTFIRASTGEPIGEFNCNESNLHYFASSFMLQIMVKYQNVILNIERKSSAQGIIDALLLLLPSKGINPFKRMFNVIVQEGASGTDMVRKLYEEVRRYQTTLPPAQLIDKCRRYFGFNTTGESRKFLYKDVLSLAVNQSMNNINSSRLANELKGLEMRNGRIDHGEGKHDDQVISWLLANWFIFAGSNLTFYNRTLALGVAKANSNAKEMTVEEEILDDELKYYRKRLAHLKQKLLDPKLTKIEITQLEAQIRNTAEYLDEGDEEVYETTNQILMETRGDRDSKAHEAQRQHSMDRMFKQFM